MKLYVAISIVVIFIILLEVIKKKQYFTNFIKNSDIIDDINLIDSNVYIGSKPKDHCLKHSTINECEQDSKCRVRQRNNLSISECVSNNNINVQDDLIVNNYIYLGSGMRRKIDINTLRRIKNMPIHFNKSNNINSERDTICLSNGSIDLPRCVQASAGNFYIKMRGKDETSDEGYDNSKDCKLRLLTSPDITGIDNTEINSSDNSFRSLNACNTYLKNNYDDITDITRGTSINCSTNEDVTNTDTNISCIQKHHIEMLNGVRPVSLRTFANVLPFTFFQNRFNEPPIIIRGLDDVKDFDVMPPNKKGPMSVNIDKNFKLIAYSLPNFRGTKRTYRYPGAKDVSRAFPNGIRSYQVEHESIPKNKIKHLCLTRSHEFENSSYYNATPSKKEVYKPEPCSYDNNYQMFFMEFDNKNMTTSGHNHPHFHKENLG